MTTTTTTTTTTRPPSGRGTIARVLLLLLLSASSNAARAHGGFDAASQGRSRAHVGGARAPVVASLYPPRAHVGGGATLTISGAGFARGPGLVVRFASTGGGVDVVPGVWVSRGEVRCVTPRRAFAESTHVTVSNGDGAFGGHGVNFVVANGAGAALRFLFDDSPPGCPGCGPAGFQRATAIDRRVRERWVARGPVVGPDAGGTAFHVEAVGWDANANGGGGVVAATLTDVLGAGKRPPGVDDAAPTGGPGLAGRVNLASRTSIGVGPPTTGTFLPGGRLACRFACPVVDAASGAVVGVAANASSETRWEDYARVRCVSPPMPSIGPDAPGSFGSSGSVVVGRDCVVTISNDGATFDDLVAEAAADPHASSPMPNAALVRFRYEDVIPTVLSIATSARVAPGLKSAGVDARGPFEGGSTVTIRGANFQSSNELSCAFFDPGAGPGLADPPPSTTRSRATFASATEVTCVAPRVAPRGGADAAGAWTGATGDFPGGASPCFSSRVSVSNDGATYSSTFAEFLHCDVYVSAGAGGSSGTPDDPFSDVQSALDAILVDAVATRPNADAEASSPSPRRRRRASFGASSAAYDALGDVDRGAVDGAKPREWTNRDVIRLAPGVYAGDGNAPLDLPDGAFATVVGSDATTTFHRRRAGPEALVVIDCVDAAARERADGGGPPQTYALGSRALFADQRVSVNVPPTFEERAGRALGPGGATFVGVVFEGCDLGGDGAVEALADAECAPDGDGYFSEYGGVGPRSTRGRLGGGAGGCRGNRDAYHENPSLAGGGGAYDSRGTGWARDPAPWEQFEYEDPDAWMNAATWEQDYGR